MENEEQRVNLRMKEVLNSIPKVFDNQKLLRYHLSFMRISADMEWFNIASVLYQYPTARIVKTTEAWRKHLCKPDLFPKQGENGNTIFLPFFENSSIRWKQVKVFDLSQMRTNIEPAFNSYLQVAINKVKEKCFKNAEKNWQIQLILNAIKRQTAYHSLSNEEINFILLCVLVSCGSLLKIPAAELGKITLNCPENSDRIVLYKTMKDVIEELPTQVADFSYVTENREKEINKIKEATLVRTRGLVKNIEHAKEILNAKLQKVSDSEILQEQEAEEELVLKEEIRRLSGAGRNENEVVLDQLIWKGDI